MALAGVLSAMRELILNTDDFPGSFEGRLAAYKARFPTLTSEEIEDLAKIPGEKFRTYTTSIYNGEGSIFENHFPITLALLKRHWVEVFKDEFKMFRFTKSLHRKRPWKSKLTKALAENLLNYLKYDLPELDKRFPAIKDAALLEFLCYQVRIHPDGKFLAARSLDLQKLEAMTVAEVMALQFAVPGNVLFQIFEHKIAPVRRFFFSNEQTLPSEIAHGKTFSVIARNRENYARATDIPEGVYEFLRDQPREESLPLESLANAYVSTCDETLTEQEMFVGFLGAVVELADCGAVVIS